MTEGQISNKNYQPAEIEAKWLKHWQENKTYHVKEPLEADYSITLPPPNVTGELHMGHALNGTIQDILIRYQRMLGKVVHWQVGCDHAGIGTQIVVEKQLSKDNLRKEDIGREAFLEKVWHWTEQHQGRIEEQMQLLGCSADWRHSNFTLNDQYARAVQLSFFELFKKGLVYRGNRLINWCPKCQTSLSDLEVVHEERKAKLYQIKYPLSNPKEDLTELIVATSRPETLFGDVAVAINPEDKRYQSIIKSINNGETVTVKLPLVNKEIPIVLSNEVKIDFGTGALKITPAHDFHDDEIAKSIKKDSNLDLEPINIFDKEAKILPLDLIPTKLHNLSREAARKETLSMLTEKEYLISEESYKQPISLHDRCNTVIEPYLSDQWFVRMESLAGLAIDALEAGQVKFHPERYGKTYLDWLNNIQDWCISRQLWWGHQIPVFTQEFTDSPDQLLTSIHSIMLEQGYNTDLKGDQKRPSFVMGSKGEHQYICQVSTDEVQIVLSHPDRDLEMALSDLDFTRDPDVLDTWFSSALWPFAAQGWYDKESSPNSVQWSNVLSTAREIINLWVSRMIFSSLNLTDKLPFTDILIHPVIQTPDGKRMSKSKGNAIDPIELVKLYGADASRLWYGSVGIFSSQDTRFPGVKEKDGNWKSQTIENKKRFINKLWNASKLIKQITDGKITTTQPKPTAFYNIWILNKWSQTLSIVSNSLETYNFSEYVESLERFIWDDLCDWYLEIAKLVPQDNELKATLSYILSQAILALHPIAPFVTEELYNYLTNNTEPKSISHFKFPISNYQGDNETVEKFNNLEKLIKSIRSIKKNLLGLSDNTEVNIILEGYKGNLEDMLGIENSLLSLAKASLSEANNASKAVERQLNFIKLQILIPDSVDLAEREGAIQQSLNKKEKEREKSQNLLNNPGFMKNASEEQINQCKTETETLQKEIDELHDSLSQIKTLTQ